MEIKLRGAEIDLLVLKIDLYAGSLALLRRRDDARLEQVRQIVGVDCITQKWL